MKKIIHSGDSLFVNKLIKSFSVDSGFIHIDFDDLTLPMEEMVSFTPGILAGKSTDCILLVQSKKLDSIEPQMVKVNHDYSVLIHDSKQDLSEERLAKFDLIFSASENWGYIVKAVAMLFDKCKKTIRESADKENTVPTKFDETSIVYQDLFNNGVAPMLIISPDTGMILNANKAALKFYGYRYSVLTSLNINQINSLTPLQIKQEMDKAMTEKRNHFNFKHVLSDGSIRDVEVYSGKIKYDEQNALFSIISDVTNAVTEKYDLLKRKDMFYSLFNEMSDGGAILEAVDAGKSFIFKDVNKQSLKIEKKRKEDYIGRKIEDLFPSVIKSGLLDKIHEVYHDSIPKRVKITIEKDGVIEFIHDNYIYKISPTEIVILYNDVTSETKMVTALEESETLYRSLYNNVPSGLLIIDEDFKIIDVNEATCIITGYSRDDLVGQFCSMVCPRAVGNDQCPIWSDIDEKVVEIDTFILNKDKKEIPIVKNSRKIRLSNKVYLMESILDISKIKKAEMQIEEDLEEKKILLREIHHRVKNNLNIISSLLNIQSRKIQTPKQALEAFERSKLRVFAIALVHDTLYKSHNLKKVPFANYVHSLVKYYEDIYGDKNITFKVKVNKEKLTVGQTMNCGLLINEIVTNSVKHAFNNLDSGIITINLETKADKYYLTVGDNGIGITEGKLTKVDSFGLQLIRMMIGQLKGEMRTDFENGLIYQFRF